VLLAELRDSGSNVGSMPYGLVRSNFYSNT
jgi:hypothetical protein